jgi:hypothetical protein
MVTDPIFFYQISTSEPNFGMKILKVKSANKWLRFHQMKVEKRLFLAKIELKKPLENHVFF